MNKQEVETLEDSIIKFADATQLVDFHDVGIEPNDIDYFAAHARLLIDPAPLKKLTKRECAVLAELVKQDISRVRAAIQTAEIDGVDYKGVEFESVDQQEAVLARYSQVLESELALDEFLSNKSLGLGKKLSQKLKSFGYSVANLMAAASAADHGVELKTNESEFKGEFDWQNHAYVMLCIINKKVAEICGEPLVSGGFVNALTLEEFAIGMDESQEL